MIKEMILIMNNEIAKLSRLIVKRYVRKSVMISRLTKKMLAKAKVMENNKIFDLL